MRLPSRTIDAELSRAVIAKLRLRPRNKNCGLNALRAMRYFSAEDRPWYVEGWAEPGIWHAWLQTREGRIVDTTPVYLDRGTGEYVAVRRYSAEQLAEHLSRPGALLPIADQLERGG